MESVVFRGGVKWWFLVVSRRLRARLCESGGGLGAGRGAQIRGLRTQRHLSVHYKRHAVPGGRRIPTLAYSQTFIVFCVL